MPTRSDKDPKDSRLARVPGVVPADLLEGDDEEDTTLLRNMLEDARTYILSHSWCNSITGAYFGGGVGGVFAIFLFNITSSGPEIDSWIWIVVGDVPPAYLPLEDCQTPKEAFATYIDGMTRWTRLARRGESGTTENDIPPIDMPATPHSAETLKNKLQLLNELVKHQFE
jgi:hypothetical protein